jgi:predicted nuclease of predicted toxin-antitoxin system
VVDTPLTIWLDAQLSPDLAAWMQAECGVAAIPLRELGLRDADDPRIFAAARAAAAVVLTKDSDFVLLLERFGPPPQVIWLTCGNTSNAYLRALLRETWSRTHDLGNGNE